MLIRLFVSFIRFCASGFNEFLDKNGAYMAASISFYTLFSMFPLLLALLSIFGFLLNSEALQEKLIRELPKQLPVGEDLVATFLRNVSDGRLVTSVVAPFALLWASTAVFGAIRKSVNIIWGIRRTRPFLLERMMDFSLMFGAAILLVIFVFTTTFLNFFQEIFAVLLPDSPPSGSEFWSRIAVAVPPTAIFFAFLIVYMWLPNTRVRLRDAWLPALLASAAFNIGTVIFVQWLKAFPAVESVYGAVSAVIAFMAWVYVSAIIMLSGVLVTSRFQAYLSARDQQRRLDDLSRSLERVRANPVVLAVADAGAD